MSDARAPMQMFRVMVKHDKKPRERKFVVWRYLVLAETAEEAIELLKQERLPDSVQSFGPVLRIGVHRVDGRIVTMDNYLSNNDGPFA